MDLRLIGDLLLHERRAHVGRADSVHGHALLRRLERDGFREADESVLRGDVRGLVWRCDEAVHRRDVHDAAPAFRVHVRQRGAREVEGAEEHHADESLPGLDRELLDRRDVLQARVVHQDVDAAEFTDRARHERVAVRLLRRVRALEGTGREVGGDSLALLGVQVREENAGALRGEIRRDRAADPARGAGDDRGSGAHRTRSLGLIRIAPGRVPDTWRSTPNREASCGSDGCSARSSSLSP